MMRLFIGAWTFLYYEIESKFKLLSNFLWTALAWAGEAEFHDPPPALISGFI